jgi:hypothetical protein
MKLFSSSRYANVTATLALAVAMGGTGYAAGALPHGKAHKPADKTAPTVVFAVSNNGHVASQLHIAPAKKKPKVKHPSEGNYAITFPGFKFYSSADVATCTESNYLSGSVTVDGSGKATLLVHTFDQDGNAADAYFNCAVWNTDGH